MRVDWYFDFISPFAYLQFGRLAALPGHVDVHFEPVLLAGILGHWGQLGPAEIGSKRRFSYRHVTWLAEQAGLPFRMPSGHPFNSLPLLRLAWRLGPSQELIARLFRFVWADGHIPQERDAWRALLAELGAPDEPETAEVKERLRRSTEAAVARGVFGVPTSIVGGQLFWGNDATDFLIAYCRNPEILASPAMRHADALPVAATRAGKPP
jgi:2-hydroxychromene-2-carboxylate isomerase